MGHKATDYNTSEEALEQIFGFRRFPPGKKAKIYGNKQVGCLVFINEGRKIIAFSYQGEAESAIVVYPLLLNYGLSAVGVDSFNCPVEIIGGPWLPSPIAAQLVKVRLFNFKAFVPIERVQSLPELSRFFCVLFPGQFLIRAGGIFITEPLLWQIKMGLWALNITLSFSRKCRINWDLNASSKPSKSSKPLNSCLDLNVLDDFDGFDDPMNFHQLDVEQPQGSHTT